MMIMTTSLQGKRSLTDRQETIGLGLFYEYIHLWDETAQDSNCDCGNSM